MTIKKYFSIAGEDSPHRVEIEPAEAHVHCVTMDGSSYKGCIFGDVCWIMRPFTRNSFFKHRSDELLVFMGSDPDNPEDLNAEIDIWIENDKLTFKTTSIVFVPAGVAHGRIEVRNLTRPLIHYTCQIDTDTYEEIPAEATAPKGMYANNRVEKYEPVDGKLSTAPEGLMTRLLWIDAKKLKGAPYMEAVWFRKTNHAWPEEHAHDFDEFLGFIGTDPEHPDELGAELQFFVDGEAFTITKSCIVYAPKGVRHSPIELPKLTRPILHFSGGNGGNYKREGTDEY